MDKSIVEYEYYKIIKDFEEEKYDDFQKEKYLEFKEDLANKSGNKELLVACKLVRDKIGSSK